MQFDLLRAENQHYLRGEPSHPYLRPPRGPRPDHNHRLQPRRQGTDRRLDLGNRPDSSHSRVSTMTESAGSLSADYTPSRAETAGGFDASSGSAVSLSPTIPLGNVKRDNMMQGLRRSINYAAPVITRVLQPLQTRAPWRERRNGQADEPSGPPLAVDEIPVRIQRPTQQSRAGKAKSAESAVRPSREASDQAVCASAKAGRDRTWRREDRGTWSVCRPVVWPHAGGSEDSSEDRSGRVRL